MKYSKRYEDLYKIMEVLTKYSAEGLVWYNVEDGNIEVLRNCSDLFIWGCADYEEITVKDIPLLESCAKDCLEIRPHCFDWLDLYCCRKSGMRPQGICYPSDKRLRHLFDACGPEREAGLGNPYEPYQVETPKDSIKPMFWGKIDKERRLAGYWYVVPKDTDDILDGADYEIAYLYYDGKWSVYRPGVGPCNVNDVRYLTSVDIDKRLIDQE